MSTVGARAAAGQTRLSETQAEAMGTERLVTDGEYRGVPVSLLDVSETIPQLGYGSHQFFRYYGKFPSVVGREIVTRFVPTGVPVLDCYAGSGTTLVEAQSAGCPSFGIDLNPLAVLACNVKTAYFDAEELRRVRDDVIHRLDIDAPAALPTSMVKTRLDKWFSQDTQRELSAIRVALFQLPPGPERQFLLVAFLGIVRRVSWAHDGEVRPHVNPRKKSRSAVLAFVKKSSSR